MAIPRPETSRTSRRTRRRLLAITSLGLAGLLAGLLAGCAGSSTASNATSTIALTQASGNWQFSSPSLPRLSSLGGSLDVHTGTSGATVTGILHSLSATAGQCLSASTPLPVSGTIDTAGLLTLSGPVPGGTLTLTGTLAQDGRSLTAPTLSVSAGACASTADPAVTTPHDNPAVTAQQYLPVSGTYTGTLTTAAGETVTLSSNLTQTSQPDANGIYHVDGTASSPGNTCIPASLPATASTVDGSIIATTYTDTATGTTLSASGTTSPDGATITISQWSIHSACGDDSGTGTLTHQ